jgi:ribose 5-phosphate isomerase B
MQFYNLNFKKEMLNMKTIKNKQLLVAADFAGYPLKEAVVAHLKEKGWEITDVGVLADSDPDKDTDLMFHRIGLRAGAMISEGEFERALLFCGTGMGIHIAASKCPRVHAGVVESVPAALRAITGNGVNVLAMGAFYVAPQMACDIADAYLGAELGSGYEWWPNFYEFHKLSIDELDAFNYEEFKANGFKVKHLGDYPIKLEKKPE